MHFDLGIEMDDLLMDAIDELEERVEEARSFVIYLIQHEQHSEKLLVLSDLLGILEGDGE